MDKKTLQSYYSDPENSKSTATITTEQVADLHGLMWEQDGYLMDIDRRLYWELGVDALSSIPVAFFEGVLLPFVAKFK